MNRSILYLSVVLFFTLLFGCKETEIVEKEVPAGEYLNVERQILNFNEMDGYAYFGIKSNVKWTISVSGSDGWLSLSSNTGDGDDLIRVNADANSTFYARTANILVTSEGGITKNVSVAQGKIELRANFSPESVIALDEAKSYTVTLTSNRSWTAAVNSEAESWCTLNNAAGESGDNTFTVNVSALTATGAFETRSRIATITLYAGDDSGATFNVYQGFGTLINGLYWAYCNVGEPGQFSSGPDDPGMLYQYNNRTPYPLTGGPPAGFATGAIEQTIDTWIAENNPSPPGWRIPTADEIQEMVGWVSNNLSDNWAWRLPAATGFSVAGIIAGIPRAEAEQATSTNLRGGIFIPVAGFRARGTGNLTDAGYVHFSSISRPGHNWDRYMFGFRPDGTMFRGNGGEGGANRTGLALRCVADIID